MPMSFMQGSSATTQQSQSTEVFHHVDVGDVPWKCFTTLMAASAMASGKATLLACIVQVSKQSALLPAE